MTVFPELDAEEVLASTKRRWDLSGPLPTPRDGWLSCPVCDCETVQARFWRFHERSGQPTVRHRCDVSFKCCSCGAVWIHGVALDEDAWIRRHDRGTRKIQWREAKHILEET